MARINIFQKLAERENIANDVSRIDQLLTVDDTLFYQNCFYTISDFVDEFCFPSWKNRGHCLDVEDFFDEIEYHALKTKAKTNVEDFISFVEIAANFCKMVEVKNLKEKLEIRYIEGFNLLCNIIIEDLSRINHKMVYDKNSEQLLIIEDKPEITAVAEIVEPELSAEIVRYNHFSLAGDLQAKKDILLRMGTMLEPKRKIIKGSNKQLEDGIFYLLNTINLRHNNCDPEKESLFKKYVFEMDDVELESWYDELYQMMLLAFLEINQLERNNRIKDLKKSIEEKK